MYGLEDCKLTLSMDRTNWRYGKADINFLVLSVCLLETAIPLYWLELDTKGNSDTKERIELMKLFINDFGAAKIDFLVADREFIGNDWFNYLSTTEINFGIRIKSNMQLELSNGEKVGAGALFKTVSRGGMISYQVKIDGINLRAEATRSQKDELVVVVSNSLMEPNLLIIYAKRWRIECLFGQLKSRGFNCEDTHVTIKDRVGNLMKFLVLSFAICYLIGLVHAKNHPILIKKHGRKLKSFFRHGYDLLIRTLNSEFNKAIKMIVTCFGKINLKEKCHQLICVMY